MINIEDQLHRDALIIAHSPGGGGKDITVYWREQDNPGHQYDPNDEDSAPPEMTDFSETIRGFCHTPGAGTHTTSYQRFAEIEVGDLILDLPATFNLNHKKDVRFRIDGEFYTQKSVGGELAKIWAAASNSNGGLQTILASRTQ